MSVCGQARGERRGHRFEARRLGCRTPMVVDLVGSGGAESRVRPVVVAPGEVGRQFLVEGGETVRDRGESPRALVLGADAALDHREAAVFADGAEPLADAAAATPALDLPGSELAALVRDEVRGLMPRAPEQALQKLPHGGRGGLPREDSEAHAPRAVVDGHP